MGVGSVGVVEAAPARARLPRRETSAIVVSEAVSTAGDQIARLALAVLVFARTHSPALSAATIAVSYLPWAVAAPLLSRLGDRYPRRRVMVASEVYRMAVCALLTIRGAPIAVLLVLLFFLTCGEPPFRAARNSLYADIFGPDAFVRGQALLSAVSTAMQFGGYALGGLVVGVLGARGALAIDAASFGVSAVTLWLLLLNRPAEDHSGDEALRRSRSGFSIVWRNPAARTVLTTGVIVQALDTVAVGLAVPWAHQLGHGSELAGLLVAASVIGGTAGAVAISRVPDPTRRTRLIEPLALLMFLLLVPLMWVSSATVTLALLFAAGMCTGLQIVTQERFILAVPAAARARAGGVAGTCLNLGQGLAVLVAGGIASSVRPSVVVGLAGVLGIALILLKLGLMGGSAGSGQPARR